MKIITYLILLSATIISCSEKIEDPIINDPTIIGLWVQDISEEYSIIKKYSKRDSFEIDKPGLKFSENGDFIFRDDCACPDSQVENYYGSYTLLNDSTIYVNYLFDNISKDNTIRIISLSSDTLKVSFK